MAGVVAVLQVGLTARTRAVKCQRGVLPEKSKRGGDDDDIPIGTTDRVTKRGSSAHTIILLSVATLAWWVPI